MCELLVRRKHAPVPESPGRWHSGDVVVVMPDGHSWGRKEAGPDGVFTIIKFPGVSVEDFEDLLVPDMEPLIDEQTGKVIDLGMMQRRTKQIDMKNLPRNEWMDKAQFRNYVVDKLAQRKGIA